MNKILCLFLFLPCFLTASQLNIFIRSCHDGDTCSAIIDKKYEVDIRLACIDAPEIKNNKSQPFAQEAKTFLNSLLSSKEVKIFQVDNDKYQRPVVFIFKNGKNINLKILEKGLAETYRGETQYSKIECFKAELKAREYRVGIWSLKKYKSPKDFRSGL